MIQKKDRPYDGITNLWITPEPVRASQRHPKSPRAGKSHPRITHSQSPESPRASQSQLEPTGAGDSQ